MSRDFARVYGSKARVRWVKEQLCCVCGRSPCENAHTVTGGTGRKGDYTTIVPLCPSCHRTQHAKGWQHLLGGTMADVRDELRYIAELTESRWHRYLKGTL